MDIKEMFSITYLSKYYFINRSLTLGVLHHIFVWMDTCTTKHNWRHCIFPGNTSVISTFLDTLSCNINVRLKKKSATSITKKIKSCWFFASMSDLVIRRVFISCGMWRRHTWNSLFGVHYRSWHVTPDLIH